MFTPILAKFPGSIFFQALMDGEPVAFGMLIAVIGLIVFGFVLKHVVAQAK